MKYTNKDIVCDPSEILRKKSTEVSFPLSEEDSAIIYGLREYVKNSIDEELCEKYDLSPAVGIAAPQVGILKKMCVVYVEEDDQVLCDLMLINPKIIAYSTEKVYIENGEACLSIESEHTGIVERPAYIKVRYDGLDGEKLTVELSDFFAIAVQHEIDHLNGILYYDHIDQANPLKASANSYPL